MDKQRALQLSDMARAICALKGGKECFGICGGCLDEATAARNEDMAAVGESLMQVIAGNQEHKLLKGWAPINDPAEIVADLLNAYDELASDLVDTIEKARVKISGGLCYTTAEAKHAQLADTDKILATLLAEPGRAKG